MKSDAPKAKISQEEKDAAQLAKNQAAAESAAADDLEQQKRRRGYGVGAFGMPLTAAQLPLLSGVTGA